MTRTTWPRRATPPVGMAGGMLTVACFLWVSPASALDAIWNFDGDLTPASGSATMSYRGDMGTNNVDFFASEHDLGLPMPFGDHSGVMRFQPTTSGQGLEINLNNGGAVVRDYTMVWDLFRPGPSWQSWLPLYQTDVANANDADFFINPGDGIGISGSYRGWPTTTPRRGRSPCRRYRGRPARGFGSNRAPPGAKPNALTNSFIRGPTKNRLRFLRRRSALVRISQ